MWAPRSSVAAEGVILAAMLTGRGALARAALPQYVESAQDQ